LAFFSGVQMSGPASVPLPPAKPGELVDISLDLVAPEQAGLLRSTWKPRSADGNFFDYSQYVEIDVKVPSEEGVNEAVFIDDVTIAHNTPMKPGQRFRKTWRIRNTGSAAWGEGYHFVFVADDPMGGPSAIPLPPTMPGEEAESSVALGAPGKPGASRSPGRPRDPEGHVFDGPRRAESGGMPSVRV